MSGGPLDQPYQLLQLHFHWGNTDDRGSEHTMDNKRFPLEMHLVHLAADIEWGVGSATAPSNVPDGLAVAGFLWEVCHYILRT
jgi:carbonic anhydrase